MVDSTKPLNVDINAIATDLNNKCDRDLVNCTRPYVESRVAVGGGIVEIWSDGFCVQSGIVTIPANTLQTIDLTQAYKDTSFVAIISNNEFWYDGDDWAVDQCIQQSSSSTIKIGNSADYPSQFSWRTEGYIR